MSRTLIVALLYAGLGELGLLLAVPPGYASPVFPAAGLAVSVLLVFGLRVLPGVWLGSFALNVFVAWKSGTLGPGSAGIAVLVATGAMLQAAVARKLVLLLLKDKWRHLESEREIGRFLVAAGPLASLTCASISVTALTAAGIVSGTEYFYSWWNWWVGDTLGVLVFAPLALTVLLRKQSPWKERLLSVVGPMLITLAFVTMVFIGVNAWEKDIRDKDISEYGEKLAQLLDRRLVAHQEAMAGFRRMVELAPEMTFEQFDYLTKMTLRDNQDIFALSYNPLVSNAERNSFERKMAKRLHGVMRDFRIMERNAERKLVPAGARPDYVPVAYISPLEGNRPALGFDINSEPNRRDAIKSARASGIPAVTAPVRLVQERRERPGVLVLHPAYRRGGGSDAGRILLGFIVGVIKVDDLVAIATAKRPLRGLAFRLTDPAADESRRLFFESEEMKAAPTDSGAWKTRLSMADRFWLLEVFPTSEYLQTNRPWFAWAAGIAGLVFATLLQMLMLAMTGRTVVIRRKVAEQTKELEATAESQRLLGAAVRQSNAAIVVTDRAGDIVFINDAFVQITGYEREEVIGKNPRFLKSGVTRRELYADLWSTITNRQTWRGELQNRAKNGTLYWEWVTISPVIDDSGSITHFIGIKENITGRKLQEAELSRAKEAAEAADLAKSQFLATMSHEIRTPMNGILGMAQLLLMKGLSESERDNYIQTILSSGNMLQALLNDILDLSKIEAGKLELHLSAFDPMQTLDEMAALFGAPARQKGLSIASSWSGARNCCYQGDTIRIRQMLANLISNAIKFTETGEIRIEATERSREAGMAVLEFSVTDTGRGVPVDKQQLLFKPFSQVDSSNTRQYAGTGLGLSIVQRFAEMMGGTVGVESEEDRGSRFWFQVKLRASEAASEHKKVVPVPQREADASDPSSILIVEDNAVNRRVIEAALRKKGFTPLSVQNGQEAVDAFTGGFRPAYVLMDCQMPVMDGFEATARIRDLEKRNGQPRIPIIALTAGAFAEDREHCLSAGMDDFLAKPLNFEALDAMLLKWRRTS